MISKSYRSKVFLFYDTLFSNIYRSFQVLFYLFISQSKQILYFEQFHNITSPSLTAIKAPFLPIFNSNAYLLRESNYN